MDVTPKNLPGYLEQIHTFLVNNGKSFIFPSLTMAMEDILANIVKDTTYLMKFNDVDCRFWSKRIVAVLETNKEIYKLSYCFEDVLGKKVMVYKKKPVPVVFKEPLGLKLLRKPHSPNRQPSSSDNTNTVMSSFKTTCLNATLKFVKNDKQLTLQYPDISTEQADFIKHMISECLSPMDVNTTPGGRGMFDPLAEALRIYTTKYEFNLNNGVPDKDDMKRLYLEKKPKKIIIPTAVKKNIETCSVSSINSQDSESHQYYTQLIQKLDNTFIRNTILNIKQFLLNDEENLEFTILNVHQGEFLMQFEGILMSSEILKRLDGQDDLKSLWMEKGVCKIKTYLEIVSPTKRTVFLSKKWAQDIRHEKDQIQINPDNKPLSKSTPKIIIDTENDIIVNATTTNSNTTSKNSVNSLPKSKIAMTFSTNTTSVTKVNNNSSNSSSTEKIETNVSFHSSNENTTPFINVDSEVAEVNNNTTENYSVAKINTTKNSSVAKTNTTENSSVAKVNTTENSSVVKVNTTDNSSLAKTNTKNNSSVAKANTTENSSVAKVNTTDNSSVAKVNTTDNSSVVKVNPTVNSSVAKTNTTKNSSVTKANTTENSSVAKVNTTENSSVPNNTTGNSSVAKVNTTENSSVAKVNTIENSSVAKVNTTKTSSVAKVNTTKNSSVAKVNTTENSSVAKVNTTDNSSVAKTNTTKNSSVAKANTTENSSVAKVNTTENSSVPKVNTTDNSSVAKVNTTENSSVAKVNTIENSSVAKVNTTKTSSVAKVNTTKNSSVAKVNTTENSSVAKVNTTVNSSVANINTTDNSSEAKTNTTRNSSVAKANTTENSSVAKVNTTKNSAVAKVNTTKNSSVAKTNATVDSLATKISVSSIELNSEKINDGNDFIVAKASKEIFKNQQLSKKNKLLLSLKTALIIANGQFIENAITKLKDFIASSKKSIEMLSFTELSKAEQEIILNWEALINRYEINCMFCVRGQMILDEIRTLLENGRKVFNVKISSKTVSPNRTVTFTRTLKKNPAVGGKTVTDPNYPDLLSYCNIKITTGPEKIDKRIQKFCNATNSLTDEWIENFLKQLNNFIQDDAQASLVIPNNNDSQIDFLRKWKTFLGMKDVIGLYNSTIQRLLIDIRINMAEKKAPWLVACSSSKRKKDLSRDMTFMKNPGFGDIKSRKRSKSVPKGNTNKAEIAPEINTSKAESSTQIVEPVKGDKGIPKSSSVTSLPVEKVQVLSEKGRPKSATVTAAGLPKAKAKLIEALSQPLVSERGVKMMKNMGWDGGALGLRGEGLMEPITLPLDLKKRAGLGCEKEQIKRSKPLTVPVMTNLPVNIIRVPPCNLNLNKMEYKIDILETILDMLHEATPAIELPFTKKLTQKQWGFIKHSVISFNEGTKYMHDVPVLRDLGHTIVHRLCTNNSILTACWGVSKTNVLFVIAKAVYQPCDLYSTEWCSVVNFNNTISDNISVNTHDDKVVVAGEAFRYYVLAQILEFCDRPSINKVPTKTSLTKEIALKGKIAQKQMSYIKDVIIRLNNKSRASSDSDNENAMFNDIINIMNGFTLDVDFPIDKCTNENKAPVNRIIRFHKILNTPKTSELNTAQTKVTNKDTKRRTTFTTDTFDEKCMFDNQTTTDGQNAPICNRDDPKIVRDEPIINLDAPKVAQDPKHDNNEPKIAKYAPIYAQDVPKFAQDPKHDQDELKHDNVLKYDQDAPKTVPEALKPNLQNHDQNTLKCVPDILKSDHNTQNHDQNAPKIVRNEPNVPNAPKIVRNAPTVGHATRCTPPNLDGVDCIICCLTEHIKNNEENVEKAVEYIFIDKETVENIGGPIDTVTKDNEVTSVKTEDFNKNSTTVANLDTDIQNLSLKDNIDEKTENLVKLPEGTIYGLYLGNTESKIQNKGKDYGKRPISNSTTPDKSCKKFRYENYFKKIVITPKNYPLNSITDEDAAKIQKSILGSIDYTDELPLLQCHGIQDGGLIYSCHTEKSLEFILNVIKSPDLFVTVSQDSEIICHRMTVKIRSFIKESVDEIFDRLETYNINLDTRNWKVLDLERGRDFVIINMEVDENSFRMIYREKFTLYTGIDQAKFSILWD